MNRPCRRVLPVTNLELERVLCASPSDSGCNEPRDHVRNPYIKRVGVVCGEIVHRVPPRFDLSHEAKYEKNDHAES